MADEKPKCDTRKFSAPPKLRPQERASPLGAAGMSAEERASQPDTESALSDADLDDEVLPTPTVETVLEALTEAGIYQDDLGQGQHMVVCPWTSEHPKEASCQALYVQSDGANPFGQFQCAHAHAPPRDATSLMEYLGLLDPPGRAPPDSGPTETEVEPVPGSPDERGKRDAVGPVAPFLPPSPPRSPPVPPPVPVPPPANDDSEEEDDIYLPAPKFNPVVDALKAAGLYRHALGNRRHSVICHAEAEHGPGSNAEAWYAEPDDANPIGRFYCTHVHKEKRTAANLIEHLLLDPATARAKARIRTSAGQIHLTTAAAERVLKAEGTFFHAGGPIVRIVDRPGIGVSSELVNDQTLGSVLSAKIDWQKSGQKGWEDCDPPSNVIQTLLRGQDRPHLQPLAGLARQPFFASDGRLITSAGYHAETGLYAVFDAAHYDQWEPTREMAERALAYLKSFLAEFPFESENDLSAGLCAMLTAAIRPTLPQAPAFNITASRSGCGKSYLASIITLMAGPGEPYNVSYPTTAEEATKVVLALLLEKPAVILFDDMTTDWRAFGALNKALTSATTTERVLGVSRTATAKTNVLFLGTGNNIEPERDMRRRVVTIRLSPRGDSPALRHFNGNPVGDLKEDRARAVGAALTVIAAHRAAGRPVSDVKPIGTFEAWTEWCRQPLLWLGEPDPAQRLIDQVTHDPDQQVLGGLLDAWWQVYGDRPVIVRKLVEKLGDHPDLMDALVELPVMEGRYVNPGKLGWYLSKNRGRRVQGLRIEPAECKERKAWRVVYGKA